MNRLMIPVVAAAALTLGSAAEANIAFYPDEGQSKEQRNADLAACEDQAYADSGFDPDSGKYVAPQEGGGEVARGAGRGALLGVVGGAIAGSVGAGAAIGAGVGAVTGVVKKDKRQQRNAAAQQQADAAYARDKAAFEQSLVDCMASRGYSAE